MSNEERREQPSPPMRAGVTASAPTQHDAGRPASRAPASSRRSEAAPRRSARASSCPAAWTRRPSSPSSSASAHPKYNKFVLQTKKLYAHDEANDVNVGDKVRVMETRPLSKTKRWRVIDVLERAK